MKNTIETTINEIDKILSTNLVDHKDKEPVLEALKEMAYHWCEANACHCAFEEVLKEQRPDVYKDMLNLFLRTETYHRIYREKMEATYPYLEEENEADC